MKVHLPVVRKPRIEMIPLIDTFFLLLAFFISAVITMEVVKGMPVDLPKAGAGTSVQRQGRLIVTVGQDGVVQLEGERVTLVALRERLSHHPGRSSLRVGIRADQSTSYRWLIQVLSVVREAGVERVTLLTQPVPGR